MNFSRIADCIDVDRMQHSKSVLIGAGGAVGLACNLVRCGLGFLDAYDFDVVTEIWFADRAGYERMLAEHAKPGVGDAIATDEKNFLDSSKTRFFVVNETGVPDGPGGP